MDSFEDIVAKCFEERNYWVRHPVKVTTITRKDKRDIGTPTMPTPEVDLVALQFNKNTLILMEIKSFLNSPGVRFSDVCGKGKNAKRYKLLNDDIYREIITMRLVDYYLENGLINRKTKIRYGLAAGNIYSRDEERIRDYARNMDWVFMSPDDIKESIVELSGTSFFEDNIITMTAKIFRKELDQIDYGD